MDTVPPKAALTSAKPSVIATTFPASTPSVALRYRGPENRAPVIRVFRTDDGKPHIVRRFRGKPDRTAIWDGRVSAGDGAHRARARGGLRVHRGRARQGRQHHRGAAAHATASVARPGTGVTVSNFTLRGPLSAVAAGQVAHFEVGPVDRDFNFAVSRLGDPKPLLHGGRVAGRFRIHIPSKMRTGVYIVRVRSRRQRAVWPLAVAGLPPRSAPRRGAPARGAAGAHLAGPEPGGRRRRRLHRPAAVLAVRGRRPPVPRRHAAEALRRRGVAAAPLARPREAAVRPHDRPGAGASRGPGARQRARAWPSPAASCGCPTSCSSGCATTSPTAAGWPRSAPNRSGAPSP